MLSKIEEYLFDFFGLVVPGGIASILIFFIPYYFIENSQLKTVPFFSQIGKVCLPTSWNNQYLDAVVIICGLLSFYLVGHVVKVFSKYFYEFNEKLFDGCIVNILRWIYNGSLRNIRAFLSYRLPTLASLKNSLFAKFISAIYAPIYYFIVKIILVGLFTFKSRDFYEGANEKRAQELFKKIYEPDRRTLDWYSLYKLAVIFSAQNKINSLAHTFLAKYNLYRSLSFIFLFSAVWTHFITQKYAQILSPCASPLITSIEWIFLVFWFAFHVKYKRYWTLCGNEALMSLYYHLLTKNAEK